MQFTGLVEFPASRIPQYHSLVLVQPLEVAATVSMVLQPLLLALAALTGAVPLVLVFMVQEEPPRLAHLHHLQERPAPKLLSLGNLAWEVPYLHPLVVASDKVPVSCPLMKFPAAVASAVPGELAGLVLQVYCQMVHRERDPAPPAGSLQVAGVLDLTDQENHVVP